LFKTLQAEGGRAPTDTEVTEVYGNPYVQLVESCFL
jgi:hypothetical protein